MKFPSTYIFKTKDEQLSGYDCKTIYGEEDFRSFYKLWYIRNNRPLKKAVHHSIDNRAYYKIRKMLMELDI